MKPVTIIEAERPGIDSAIIWDNDGQLVAFAYEHGRVMQTRPLVSDDPLREVTEAFRLDEIDYRHVGELPVRNRRLAGRWT